MRMKQKLLQVLVGAVQSLFFSASLLDISLCVASEKFAQASTSMITCKST